ncbi:MAG TPA: HAD-IA family hydrolase [Tepidisphaeraceae bacterium]|nr:HAD-IA family hydrolase [Tepidisphaeraceae bacterium]
MASKTSLVIFDLGQVLIRVCRGWRAACENAGLAKVPSPDAVAVGRFHEVVCDWDCGRLSAEQFAAAVAPVVGLSPADVTRVQEAYLLGPFPGVDALLDDLAGAGVATACLSNTNPSHWQMMLDASGPNALPLHKLTHRFASHLMGCRKPNEQIYREVEKATGVPADGIVFFDDAQENVDAARALGWHAHRIDPEVGDPIAQVRRHLQMEGVLPERPAPGASHAGSSGRA